MYLRISKVSKRIIRAGLGSAIVALAFVLTSTASTAGPQAVLRPDPVSLGLRSGEQGTISILAEDVQNIYGAEFHLQFDPNVLEVIDVDPSKAGVQIAQGDWLQKTFVAVNKVDNAAGKIDYAVTMLNPTPPVSGSGKIATITFKAKNNGTSPLRIQKAILASRDGKEIKSEWQDGAVGVSPFGQAPSVSQTRRSGDTSSDPASSALPIREIVLIGAAGLGVLLFLGALIVVGVVLFMRRR